MKTTHKNKKTYLLTILVVLGLGTVFTACSNSDDTSPQEDGAEGYFKCKIDGTPRTFNYSLSANDKPDDFNAIHFVTIGGLEGNDPSKSPGFGFQLVSDEGAKETTYTVANGEGPELRGQYYTQDWVNGNHVGTTSYRGDGSDGSTFTLTISSITNWGVKGTFSGLLENNGVYLSVTEGEFSAPYNKN